MEVDIALLGLQYATSSGPKSFHDVSALNGDDERTDHVLGCLSLWEDACRARGNASRKAKTEAVEIFIQADEIKIQPSWVRQWIRLVYGSGPKEPNEDDDDDCRSTLSLSTDSAFDGPFPTERYALFLEYYSKLRLDSNDADGSALRVLNAERKRAGIGWTLEHVDKDEGEDFTISDVEMTEELSVEDGGWRDEGRWRGGGSISGDTRANYSTEYDQENMDVDIEVNLGVVSMPDVSPLASLSDFAVIPSPDTSATGKPRLEYMDLSQPEKEASSTYENFPTSFPPTPLIIAVPVENAPADPPMQNEQASYSIGLASISMSQNDATCIEWFDSTMEDADALPHPTNAPSAVRGPSSIYDLGGILYPPEGIETAHIREKLLQWKQLDLLQLGTTARRPTRQEDAKSEKLKQLIARDLGIVDAQLVQPSWASQWIQFILDAHDPHSRHLIVYDPSFSPTVPDLVLLLRFFALLMNDTQKSRDEALTLVNSERKKRDLGFTLELPKYMAREFKNTGAVVDHDVLMQIEQMPYPISGGITDMVLDSCVDPGGNDATICDGLGPKCKTPRPKSTPAGGRAMRTPPPCSSWKRPEPLPFFEPAPLSSKPADLASRYTDMLAAIGKPEPQTRHVWAKTRTDLCETAPYFRQAQAGIHVDKVTRMIGYLLDGFPSPGDIWAREGRLIVSHGGGGSHQVDKPTASPQKKAKTQERIVPSSSIALPRHIYDQSDAMPAPQHTQPKPRNVTLGADQSHGDRTIRNLIKAKESGVPVVLIVGRNYRWWPLRMVKDGVPNLSSDGIDGEQERGKYAVLGWYRVRDTWEEFEPGNQSNDRVPLFVRRKFAFEWVEAQGTPWWLTDMEEALSNWLSHISIPKAIPDGVSSPRDCGSEPVQCQQISAIDLWGPECCEVPPGLKEVPDSIYQCVKCLEISPIIYHDGWFCTNAQCSQMGMMLDDRFAPEITLSYSQDFIDRPTLPQPALTGLDGNDIREFLAPIPEGWPAGWSVIPRYRDGLKSYERVHWNGRCCLACGRLNSKVQWNVWTCATCSKIIERESADTYPLVEFLGPWTKGGLNMPTLLPDCVDDPNTCVLYAHLEDGGDIYVVRTTPTAQPFESMFMDFQRQALSRDMFRRSPLKSNQVSGLHTKHFQHNAGVPYNFSCQVTTESFEDGPPVVKQARDLLAETASRILNRDVEFNEVLSCAYKKEQSMNYHSDDDIGVQGTIAALSLGSPALMTFRPKKPRRKKSEEGEEEAKEGNKKRFLVSPPPCLGFRLQHGDILIMDGIGIQQNYQHQVVPEGLRFAATARLIERPEGEDGLEHPGRWKATKRGRKKKSDAAPVNPLGLVSFPSSSFADTPAAIAMDPRAVTPVIEELILNFSCASNTETIPPGATTLDPHVHITNAPDSLLGAEASTTSTQLQ